MSPKPFYEVKPTHYLFNKQETPEEKVRQWVLFELLSTYAVHIGNIEVEKPVKVGTRTHYADIVIYQEHIPHVVIECKNQDNKAQDKSLEQAISYASCLGAKYAVYTNGRDWIVKRSFDGSWEVVPDLPTYTNSLSTKKLDDFAKNYEKLMPILYWAYTAIPLEYRFKVYRMLQEFFMERFWYCNSSRELVLCESADDLLRMATNVSQAKYCNEENQLKATNNYIDQKSRCSYIEFLKYCKMIGFSCMGELYEEYIVKGDIVTFGTRMIAFYTDLSKLANQSQKLSNLEANVIKFMKLVMDHLWHEWKSNQSTPIPESIMLQFLKIATPICETYLGISLPEREDDDGWSSFRGACWDFAHKGKDLFT